MTAARITPSPREWMRDLVPLCRLHRAYVSLPGHLCEAERPLQERVVFFEVPAAAKPWEHLEDVLRCVWGAPTSEWCEQGFIYNIYSAREMLEMGTSVATSLDNPNDLRLFESGWGGRDGIGAEHVHYSRARDVDLFVTPRIAARLTTALVEIERLYADHAQGVA